MDLFWGPIDIERWHETDCIRGRLAVEQDVKNGMAVFYLQGDEPVAHVDIGLPHCAILQVNGQQVPVVVVQSERAGEKHYLGYRPVSGGNGLCLISEVQLLEQPNETFYRYA